MVETNWLIGSLQLFLATARSCFHKTSSESQITGNRLQRHKATLTIWQGVSGKGLVKYLQVWWGNAGEKVGRGQGRPHRKWEQLCRWVRQSGDKILSSQIVKYRRCCHAPWRIDTQGTRYLGALGVRLGCRCNMCATWGHQISSSSDAEGTLS